MKKPLINKKYLLEKFQGKGGWTYARIPDILPDKHAPFGWVRVQGTIDNFEIKNYHLMPMGNGKLFLPVKAAIRKKIGKAEGDYVHVILYRDDLPVDIPEELQLCFLDEPNAYEIFLAYTDGEKKAFIDWIYSAKKEETKIERIAKTISKIQKRQRLTDKDQSNDR
jgi:Domain of unknown function (DUF1905)/Bacteriocin-protection, YdeI or OmpD-Associated